MLTIKKPTSPEALNFGLSHEYLNMVVKRYLDAYLALF